MGRDGKIFFFSERDSIYNIWRIDADGKEPEAGHLPQTFGVQFPTISPDGRRPIIYETNSICGP